MRAALAGMDEVLQGMQEWKAGPLEGAVRALCEERGWKRGVAYMVLRVAVTCRTVSTPLFETMELLGREECFRRTGAAAQAARQL